MKFPMCSFFFFLPPQGKKYVTVQNGWVKEVKKDVSLPISVCIRKWNMPVCQPFSSMMEGFIAFPCSLQKLPSAGGLCMLVNIYTYLFSFQIIAVSSHLVLALSSHFNISILKSMPPIIPFLLGLTG
jgi:hypothetical protein